MRFVIQNKKRMDPRYFLNEAEENFDPTSDEAEENFDPTSDTAKIVQDYLKNNKNIVPQDDTEQSYITKAAYDLRKSESKDAPQIVDKLYQRIQQHRNQKSGTTEIPQKDPLLQPEKSFSLSDIKGTGAGIRCQAAVAIQNALLPMVRPLVPEGPNKEKILKRLQDGKVGPSTASVYNYIAKNFYGLEVVPLNTQGFQRICNLNPQELNAVAYQAKKISAPVLKTYVANALKADTTKVDANLAKIGTAPKTFNVSEPTTSATSGEEYAANLAAAAAPTAPAAPAKPLKAPPGGLYQRTPKEASGRDQDEEVPEELQESINRETSYNRMRQQKSIRLFKALIQG